MPFIVVRHGSAPALLHRQAENRAIERLDLRLFIDREDDGMGGRGDLTTSRSLSMNFGSLGVANVEEHLYGLAAEYRCEEDFGPLASGGRGSA